MRKLTCILILPLLAVGQSLGSQDAGTAAAAADRKVQPTLAAALAKAAHPTSVAFEARWLWADTSMMGKRSPDGAPNVRVRRVGPPANSEQVAKGTAYDNALEVQIEGKDARRILSVGRHCLESMPGKPWQLIDRRSVGLDYFLPDPATIFLALGGSGFRVLDRSIGEHEGRAVETYALTLDREQCDALVRSGAINDPDPRAQSFRRIAERSGADPNTVGHVFLDVAIDVDVTTQQIHRLHVRALAKELATGEMLRRFGGRGRRGAGAKADAGDPASAAKQAEPALRKATEAPTEFHRGLPVRGSQGRELRWLEITFGADGAAPALQLSREQLLLLGRK